MSLGLAMAPGRVESSQIPKAQPAQAAIETSLVLELSASRLRLMQGRALLREYPVAAIELGRPMTLFVPRDVALPASDRIWILERLDPKRRFTRPIILPAAPGAGAGTVEIPLAPEEAIPAPDRYSLRFRDGLTIEIAADGPENDPAWRTWPRFTRWRLRELGQSVAWRPEAQLRLVLPRSEAGALYRSLPDSVHLIIR